MYHQDKELEGLVAQVKKISQPSLKVNKIIDYLKQKAVSPRHEDCLIVERILAYSDADSDESLPALSPKEIAEVIGSSLGGQESLSLMLVLYSSWDKCKRSAAKDIDWRTWYENSRRDGLLLRFNKWLQEASYSDTLLTNQVLSRVLAGLPNFLQF